MRGGLQIRRRLAIYLVKILNGRLEASGASVDPEVSADWAESVPPTPADWSEAPLQVESYPYGEVGSHINSHLKYVSPPW